MSSPAAVVGLTFDGVDVQLPDLQIFLEIKRGLNESPTVRGVDVTVPALAGRVEGNRVNDVLSIELEGIACADEALSTRAEQLESYRENAATVRELFRPDRLRAQLVAELEDGRTLAIMAKPLPGHTWNEHPDHAHIGLDLEGYGDWVEL